MKTNVVIRLGLIRNFLYGNREYWYSVMTQEEKEIAIKCGLKRTVV